MLILKSAGLPCGARGRSSEAACGGIPTEHGQIDEKKQSRAERLQAGVSVLLVGISFKVSSKKKKYNPKIDPASLVIGYKKRINSL